MSTATLENVNGVMPSETIEPVDVIAAEVKPLATTAATASEEIKGESDSPAIAAEKARFWKLVSETSAILSKKERLAERARMGGKYLSHHRKVRERVGPSVYKKADHDSVNAELAKEVKENSGENMKPTEWILVSEFVRLHEGKYPNVCKLSFHQALSMARAILNYSATEHEAVVRESWAQVAIDLIECQASDKPLSDSALSKYLADHKADLDLAVYLALKPEEQTALDRTLANSAVKKERTTAENTLSKGIERALKTHGQTDTANLAEKFGLKLPTREIGIDPAKASRADLDVFAATLVAHNRRDEIIGMCAIFTAYLKPTVNPNVA